MLLACCPHACMMAACLACMGSLACMHACMRLRAHGIWSMPTCATFHTSTHNLSLSSRPCHTSQREPPTPAWSRPCRLFPCSRSACSTSSSTPRSRSSAVGQALRVAPHARAHCPAGLCACRAACLGQQGCLHAKPPCMHRVALRYATAEVMLVHRHYLQRLSSAARVAYLLIYSPSACHSGSAPEQHGGACAAAEPKVCGELGCWWHPPFFHLAQAPGDGRLHAGKLGASICHWG